VVVLRDGEWVASHDSAQLPVRRLVEDTVGCICADGVSLHTTYGASGALG